MHKTRFNPQEMNILAVDDTVANIQVLMKTLVPEGYRIAVAPNGKVALEIAIKTVPDLILLDVMMPVMDGFETCAALKSNEITRDIPVIFITAKIESEDIVKGFQLGAVDYVTKPFRSDEVLARVRTQLQLRSSIQQLEKQNDWYHDAKEIIGKVLMLSLEDISLEVQLSYTLELLLTMAPLPTQKKGCIFLVDESGTNLTMVAKQDFTDDLLTQCQTISFGECVCGRAAENREISFAGDIDEHYKVNPGKVPHGHYCVPIIADEFVQGVICLYLDHGCQRQEHDEDFLIAIANTLAGLIKRKKINDLNAAKSLYFANTVHDLRTPLNAIINYGEIVLETIQDEGAEKIEADDIKKIVKAGYYMMNLVNDVMDLSKLEAGKVELYFESFDFRLLIAEIEDIVAPMVAKNGNRLDVKIADDVGMVYTDNIRIHQVIINILSNACKFTMEGTLTLNVYTQSQKNSVRLIIVIADTGIGMTPEQLGNLFQPYAQASKTISSSYGGTGLGLALSRKLCAMMRGTIKVISSVGEGSEFTVNIPVTRPASG